MSFDAKQKALLRRVYADIINGYTLSYLQNSTFYVKHLSVFEQGLIDSQFVEFYDKAISKGILKDEEALKKAYESGAWTRLDESFFESHSTYIDNLLKTKKNLFLSSEIEHYNNQIRDAHVKLGEKRKARDEVIGFTAELYAAKKINELYIRYSYFTDKSCKEQFFTEDVYSYIDDEELSEFVRNYNRITNELVCGPIKQIAVQDFFQSAFGLCDDNIYYFYGIPVCQLTFYQTELAAFGRYFKHIFDSAQIPEDLKNEPDKIIDWFSSSQNAKKVIDSTKGSVGVVGASQEDIKSTGQGSSNAFYDMVRGKKNLNATELMKLSGVEGV